MSSSPNSSFEDALKRARKFLQNKEYNQSQTNISQLAPVSVDATTPKRTLNHSKSFQALDTVRTPEEYKRQLQQRRLSDIIFSSPPGVILWPSGQKHLAAESDLRSKTADLTLEVTGTSIRESEVSTNQTAEEKLRIEAAKMRAAEERELLQIYDDADRQARGEHEKFLKRYTDLQAALEAQYRRDEEGILLEVTRRKQLLIAKAKRDSEMLLRLHKTLSEKSAESEKAFELKSKEIFEKAEKARQEQEKFLQQEQLQILKETNRKKFAGYVRTIDETIASLQHDLHESRSAKEQLIEVKASLEDATNFTKSSVMEEALDKVKNILETYASAVGARENRRKAEEAKILPKQKAEINRYLQAVERLKKNAERYSKFIEENKTLRGKILRFVQLTVNKIQKQTDNRRHVLSFMKLFTKESVPVGIGNETLSIAGQVEALSYAMDLTAKKILDNVEKLPSDPIQEWVPHATVVASLWSITPLFGELFLDNLVSRCPFLIPLYFDDLNEKASLAYIVEFVHYKNETWSSFIRRMGYYARLLGIICSLRPEWGPTFSQCKMWTLLTTTTKCELRSKELSEVCAMVMKSLLETSGRVMKEAYGHQFSKYVHLLCTEYYEKLCKHAKNAPTVVSLEIFMKEIIAADGKFPAVS